MSSKPVEFFIGIYFLGIVLLLSFFPLVVSGSMMDPTQLPKTFVFLYSGLAIGSCFVLYLLWRKNDIPFRITTIDIVAGIILVYMLANRYLLQDVVNFSFKFYELLGLTLICIIIRQTNTKYTPWLLLAMLVGGLLQALYGNLQLYGIFPSWHADFKLTGSFFNPGPYAGYLVSVFPAALGIWLFRNRLSFGNQYMDAKENRSETKKKYLFKYTALVAGAAILLVLPASQSRAAIMAVIASSAYILLCRYNGKEQLYRFLDTPFKKITAFLLVCAIIIGGLGAGYWVKKDSADGRLLIWKITAQMIKDQPLAGLGFDRFRAGYMDAQAAWFLINPDDPSAGLAADNHYAFNEFLQFTAEQGLIGLSFLLLLGILIVRTSDEANSLWLILSKAGILSVVVFAFFSYPAQILPIKLNLVLFLAIIASYGKTIPLNFSFPQRLVPWFKGVITVLILAASVWGVLHLNELRNASKTWKQGLDLYNSGNIEQSLLAYEEVYPVFNREGDFLTNYGKALSMAGEHQQAIEILHEAKQHVNNTIIQTALGDSYLALGTFGEAEEAYQTAVYMLPDRFYPKYLLATFYEETGKIEQAVSIARELVDKEPKIPSTAVNEIKAEMERLLLADEYQRTDRSATGFTNPDNLPVEFNKRIVISEKCDKVVYSSNKFHAFNPAVITGVFTAELVDNSMLLHQGESDYYPYSVSSDCSLVTLVSENPQTRRFTVYLYDLETVELLPLPQDEHADNGYPLFSPEESLLAWLSDGELSLYNYESGQHVGIGPHPLTVFQNVTWSASGSKVYLQDSSSNIWQYDVQQKQFKQLWESPGRFYTDRMITPSATDENTFYFLSDHESNVNQIYKYTAEGEISLIIESPYDKFLLRHPVSEEEIWFRENKNGSFLLKKFEGVEITTVEPEEGVVYGVYPFQDGLISVYAGLNQPASIFKTKNGNKTDLLDQPKQQSISSPQKILNESGMVHLLYLPDTGTIRNWVLWLHGGPHEQMSVRYHVYINQLVQAGFGVIALNYPGSTGIGREFEMRNKPFEERLEHQLEAIEHDLVHIAASQLNMDLNGVYVIGVSYGSILAHLLSQRDVINVEKLIDFSGLYANADAVVEIPKLYIHGLYDYALESAGRVTLLRQESEKNHNKRIVINDEGHIIHRSGNIQQILQEMLTFFNTEE